MTIIFSLQRFKYIPRIIKVQDEKIAMKKSLMKKIFVFGIIYLLFGTSIQYLTQRNSTLQAFKDESKNTFCQNSSDNTPDYYAVIAACSRYKNPSYNLPKKPFPPFSDETLMVFYKTLLQSKNWDKNHIILLLNENATKHKIINALQYIANIIEPTDYFLFSWSGHPSGAREHSGQRIHPTLTIKARSTFQRR